MSSQSTDVEPRTTSEIFFNEIKMDRLNERGYGRVDDGDEERITEHERSASGQ
jgi:hypothetical protein